MLSANNILSPAHGRPLVTPTQDMVIGAYYLTELVKGAKGEGRVFRRLYEIERATKRARSISTRRSSTAGHEAGIGEPIKTTYGRLWSTRCCPTTWST